MADKKEDATVENTDDTTPNRLKEVSYHRLVNTGNYENVRVGATLEIGDGQSPNQAIEELRQWVDAHATSDPHELAMARRSVVEMEAVLSSFDNAMKSFEPKS